MIKLVSEAQSEVGAQPAVCDQCLIVSGRFLTYLEQKQTLYSLEEKEGEKWGMAVKEKVE